MDPLLTNATQELIAALPSGASELEVGERLRKFLPVSIARRAAQLHALRQRARAKFGCDVPPFLTSKSLEQATAPQVAQMRADRIRRRLQRRTGPTERRLPWLIDATAGLGSDALALGAADVPVIAIERDTELVRFLDANLKHAGLSKAYALQADSRALPASASALVLDPDRRALDDRRKDPTRWSPTLAECFEMLRAHRGGCLKLPTNLPLASLDDNNAPPHHRQWTSFGGELRELTLWTGDLLPEGSDVEGDEIVHVGRDGTETSWSALPRVVAGLAPDAAASVSVILEPDPAFIGAQLVGALAHKLGMEPLSSHVAYLGGKRAPEASPLYRRYRVLASAPADRKRVRAMLREHGVGEVTVKKRGHARTAEELGRVFRGPGEARGLLIVSRLERGHRAYLAKPWES